MKFNFKIQQYQTDAVDAVVKVFQGQGFHDKIRYIHDLGIRDTGKMNLKDMQMALDDEELGEVPTVVACGGLSPAIVPHCRTNVILDQDLLLEGLLAIYRRNTPPKQR